MKKQKIKLGDVYQILLPNGKYAYGRFFRDACIAIYRNMSVLPGQVPQTEDYQFVVGVYNDVLKSGKWPVVENRPFKSEDESWPPPMCVIDKISGKYEIYYKGELIPSNEENCSGLEEAAVWEAEHIVDRIMGIDIWHKD